jgi:hypothetical protein
VRRGGRNREAVPKRDRRSSLQTRRLDHPGRPRKVRRERRTKIYQRLVGGRLALVTRYSVMDLHEVDPAHRRAIRKQADAHRAAIPVFANRPPSCRGDRRATSTISSSGCKRARSRNAFGITTCPLAPIRPVIPGE